MGQRRCILDKKVKELQQQFVGKHNWRQLVHNNIIRIIGTIIEIVKRNQT
jgi:hypothetical protein